MDRWINNYCQANGVDIHYVRTGGNKPPVVLLHGLMLNGACWAQIAKGLEAHYDVIMPDARGHGQTCALNCGYSYDNLAADVESFIEALGLTTPILIGHSMGGMTAALVASQKRTHLRGLILVDPTFLTPQLQQEVHDSGLVNLHRRILAQPREDYLADSLKRHRHRPQELIELFVEARFQTSIHAFEILKPPNPNYLKLIRNLDIPSLLVIGDVGSVVSIELATELTSLNKYLEFVQIKECGHSVPYDQPVSFLAVVQTFIESVC